MIGTLLGSEDVVLGVPATDAKRACEEVAAIAASRHQLDVELVFRALWRREQIGSTGIGHGIATPMLASPALLSPS